MRQSFFSVLVGKIPLKKLLIRCYCKFGTVTETQFLWKHFNYDIKNIERINYLIFPLLILV